MMIHLRVCWDVVMYSGGDYGPRHKAADMRPECHVRTMLFQTHGNLQKKPHGQEDPGRDAYYEPTQEVNKNRFQDKSYARSGITDEECTQDTADSFAGAD
jgi:hypothetical protein